MADVIAQVGPLRPSNYLLDTFGMPELSQLGRPTPPTLAFAPTITIPRFVAMTIFQLRIPSPQKALFLGLIRRTLNARAAYEAGALAIAEQLEPSDVTMKVGPIFNALSHYETCVTQADLALAMLHSILGRRWFTKGDGSAFERLRGLHNDIKHAEKVLLRNEIPDGATVPVWITNAGLKSQNWHLSYEELAEILEMLSREVESILELPERLTSR